MIQENIETLSQLEQGTEDVPAEYQRHDGKCTITADAQIIGKILGVNMGGMTGAVTVEIDGKVSCASGGTYKCKTVDCIDIYNSFR